MSMSSNMGLPIPVRSLQYRDISNPKSMSEERPVEGVESTSEPRKRRRVLELTEEELANRIAHESANAVNAAELRLRQEYEQKVLAARAPIVSAVTNFEARSDEYFAKLEMETVKLALAIAAKILHRESHLDPMLVASLVRLAMENMREGSNVTIRVGSGKAEAWRSYFSASRSTSRVEVAEDPGLNSQDCVVETELGSADFGLDKQLKEIEQGFFDLLALRPGRQ